MATGAAKRGELRKEHCHARSKNQGACAKGQAQGQIGHDPSRRVRPGRNPSYPSGKASRTIRQASHCHWAVEGSARRRRSAPAGRGQSIRENPQSAERALRRGQDKAAASKPSAKRSKAVHRRWNERKRPQLRTRRCRNKPTRRHAPGPWPNAMRLPRRLCARRGMPDWLGQRKGRQTRAKRTGK